MLRKLLRKRLENSLRKVKKFESKGSVVKNESKELKNSGEDKDFYEAKKRIMEKYKECSIYDLLEEEIEVEKYIDMEYKKYPNHIDHWNRNSKNYVESPLEEAKMNRKVDGYNDIIDNFKNSLRIQREVMEKIKKLDRPYLKGEDRGNTSNVYNEVKDYANREGLFKSPDELTNDELQNLRNEKMFVNNLPFHSKLDKTKNIEELEKIQEDSPVNSHFNPKGYKFDVEVPYEKRYPHVADRLGHPEIFLTPFESLLRLDKVITHPNFLDQPFIQVPNTEPEKDVDFTTGELLYENQNSNEWSKFIIYTANSIYFYLFAYMPFHKFFYTSTMSHESLMEYGMNFITTDPRIFDSLGILPIFGLAFYGSTFYVYNGLINMIVKQNISKIQYNKKKDLIFVKGISWFGREKDYVYEMDHLEIKPGYNKTASSYLDFSDKGMFNLTCLNTFNTLSLHNDPKYWNTDLKQDFFQRVTRLWDKNYIEDGVYENYSES